MPKDCREPMGLLQLVLGLVGILFAFLLLGMIV